MSMREDLERIEAAAKEALEAAADGKALEDVRVKFLGKKGELTAILKQMGGLSADERPQMGQLANKVRADIENAVSERGAQLKELLEARRIKEETIDVTMPGKAPRVGKLHPLNKTLEQVEEIFLGMGFEIVEGPEVEKDYYCFEALNMPPHHPARDTQDTFYISDSVLLRTQTSSVQVRVMEKNKPPIRIISPGRVYRSDTIDATHSPLFHQVEGLVIDKGVTMADLKGTLELLMKRIYGEDTKTRLRPHHFPYTEPSAEVDLMCYNCHGAGCPMCKNEGYIELLGAGMVHPKVLENCGGFAFGIGLERLTMGNFQIKDMRMLYENDVRFLDQF